MPTSPGYELKPIQLAQAAALISKHHAYRSAGSVAVYCFGVLERGAVVAAFVWQPPPPGCARSVWPEHPRGVLSLSRMVAVPRAERQLNHSSKPLRRQMRVLIDRTRWPALVTFSDEGLGHTGHVYKCSGWKKTTSRRERVYTDAEGNRRSRYSNGKTDRAALKAGGWRIIQRWEHWMHPTKEEAADTLKRNWRAEPSGRRTRSGKAMMRLVRR